MRGLSFLSAIAIATGLVLAEPGPAQATLLVNDGPGWGAHGFYSPCDTTSGTSFGYRFSTAQAITVDGLGIWDYGFSGVHFTYPVGLWTGDGSPLIASAVVTDGTSTPLAATTVGYAGRWLFESISPVTLMLGSYLLGMTIKFEEFMYFHHSAASSLNAGAGITVTDALVAPGP